VRCVCQRTKGKALIMEGVIHSAKVGGGGRHLRFAEGGSQDERFAEVYWFGHTMMLGFLLGGFIKEIKPE